MRRLAVFTVLAMLWCAAFLSAQALRVTGRVLDPTGAVIPGADVQLSQATTVVISGTTDENGNFALNVAPGDYQLEITVGDAFIPIRQNLRVTPNMGRVTIAMKLAGVNTNVDVGTDSGTVSVDADAALTSTALTQDLINTLPDDEDALLAQLQQIAGASGAADSSATVVVDGFTGGRTPSRDQIQQIIIDTNTFSAENTGGPRIQIITKPGTGPWSGSINTSYGDAFLNARNPFDSVRLPRQQNIVQTSYGGPVIPGKLTMRLNGRTVQQDSQSGSVLAITPTGTVSAGVFSPYVNRNVNLTGQLYFTPKNTLNFTGNYNTNAQKNAGIGGFTLPERATNFKGHNVNVQFIERATLSPTFTSEARFYYFHNQNSNLPVSEGLAINVLGAFNSGGAQNRTRRRGTNMNFGNTLRWTVNPKLNLQLGTDFTYNDNHSASETNYLGTFTFASLADYESGQPIQFSKTTGNPTVDVSQWEFAAFAQADWKVNSKMNIGTGVRYQAQTNLHDFNNLAPTFQIAYQLYPKTVVRAGARLTYQVFNIGNTEQLIRQNGTTNQITTIILNPTTYPSDPTLSAGAAVGPSGGSISLRAPDLVAPYNVNAAATLEQALPKAWRVSASMDMTRVNHSIHSRNINAPYPGTPISAGLFAQLSSFDPAIQSAARDAVNRMRPYYPVIGNINMLESAGNSFSRNLTLKVLPPPTLKVFKVAIGGQAQYTLGWSNDDGPSAMNPYDWHSEWARSSFDARHRFQGSMNLTFPRAMTASFIVLANSGRPYSITTGQDNNGDENTNDRPAGVARNSAIGPGSYNVNMNVTKTIQLRRSDVPRLGNNTAAAPGAAIVSGPVTNNPAQPSGPRLVFNVSATNLLNNTQLSGYSGVLTSPLFGKPIGSAPGRNVNAGMTLNW